VGTAALLERWGERESVCKAGLFHSIYGTEIFKRATVSFEERPAIAAMIGEQAERLAYLFCAFERSSLLQTIKTGAPHKVKLLKGGLISVSEQEVRDLTALYWANELEQSRDVNLRKHNFRAHQNLKATARYLKAETQHLLAVEYGMSNIDGSPRSDLPSLERLLNVEDASGFIREEFSRSKVLARGPVERLAGLVDYDFDALVKMPKKFTKAFFRTTSGEPKSISAHGHEKALYEGGFTIYFHGLNCPGINHWVSAMNERLGLVAGMTTVSAFASQRGLGLKPHYDLNDNFVCQARGKKRWRIAPNTHVVNPTAGYTIGNKPQQVHLAEAPNGMPNEMPASFETHEFVPGDVMFMPRGMWHDTETTEESSLHFNIQSGMPLWCDLVEYVLERTPSKAAAELRGPILNMFEGAKLMPHVVDELKTRLRHMLSVLENEDVAVSREAFFRFAAHRKANNTE
jgi:50S ribosomal protein L16 3-hydroxylase